MLQTVTFIFNQFLHVTFSHMFAVSFVQDTPWFCGLILIHLFYIKLLVYSFWCFETITYNKQSSIKDTSFSFLYDFMTKGFKKNLPEANWYSEFWFIFILKSIAETTLQCCSFLSWSSEEANHICSQHVCQTSSYLTQVGAVIIFTTVYTMWHCFCDEQTMWLRRFPWSSFSSTFWRPMIP